MRNLHHFERESRLTMMACSAPPEGQARWTLRPLADRLVALEVVETISTETVRRTLKFGESIDSQFYFFASL